MSRTSPKDETAKLTGMHGVASGHLLTLIASARLHKLDPEVYLRDVFRVVPHCRYLELAPRYWRITRARLRTEELDREVGWLTIPEPLPTMPAINGDVGSTAATAPSAYHPAVKAVVRAAVTIFVRLAAAANRSEHDAIQHLLEHLNTRGLILPSDHTRLPLRFEIQVR